MLPRILIQHVRVVWTKASRGNPGATRRNAVPNGFEVPAAALTAAEAVAVHRVLIDESVEFRRVDEPIETFDGDGVIEVGCVRVRREGEGEGEGARVRFEYGGGGLPKRERVTAGGKWVPLREDVCLLSLGQWARIEWNARFVTASNGQWWYERITVNVALGATTPDLFAASSPTAVYSQLADLF